MKLINREIDALLSKLEEERSLAYKKEMEDFKTNSKVIKLSQKLESDYKKIPKELKSITRLGGFLNHFPEGFWFSHAISYLKLVPKTPKKLDSNTRRDIILASADSATIEEVLTKLKLKK